MRIYMQTGFLENKPPRYYQIILEKDLLGGWSLVRESGQQGGSGRVTREHYTDFDTAQLALERLRDKQLAQGFKVVFIQGQEYLP
ncbi:MAG: WGR domain-containing protein [Gammaproteobacteria bacterium]|nr:WGR domain-containing protein [Gammaproteobacteria bacterium]